jgi:DNA-binding CsgD family transcriptional regulator
MGSGNMQAALQRLWDELSEFPAPQTDAALMHALKTLCAWLQADDGFWVGAVRLANGSAVRRDGQRGWRGRVVQRLNPPSPEMQARSLKAMQEQDSDPGLTTRAIVGNAGSFRVYRLRDGFIDFKEFRSTRHYRVFYQEIGIHDRLWVMCPVNADAESCFVFDHLRPRRRFSVKDATLAADALRPLRWFHRNLLFSHGLLIAKAPLSPAQRRTLVMLLTDRTEREIAECMQLKPGTVHQYAVEIYQRFGVKGRAGLMALWLGR